MEIEGQIEDLPWPVMTDKGPGLLTTAGCFALTEGSCVYAQMLYPLSIWCPNFIETDRDECANLLYPCFCKRTDRSLCQLWLAAQRLSKFIGLEEAEQRLNEELNE